MYLRLGVGVQISLYYVLSYTAKISAQHGIGFILDRCIVYLRLTMPNLQKKRLLIFEIFNIKKCTLFLEPSIYLSATETLICRKEMSLIGSTSFSFAQNTIHDFQNTVLNS